MYKRFEGWSTSCDESRVILSLMVYLRVVTKFLRHFFYRLKVSWCFYNLEGINVIFCPFMEVTNKCKVFFSFWSWYFKVSGAIQNVFEAFLYCLCAFLHFFAINVIFSHYPVVTKGRKVVFWYSSQYSKLIGESWKKIKEFDILFMCVIWLFEDFSAFT